MGGMMAGVRYAAGKVLVRIQDLVLADGFSVFWAAVGHENDDQFCDSSAWTRMRAILLARNRT